MRTAKRIQSGLLFILTGLAATLCTLPADLNYQGRLSDAAGAPLDNGTYTLEFNIYDTANGANKVWGPFLFDGSTSPGHAPGVVVLQGRFNVILDAARRANDQQPGHCGRTPASPRRTSSWGDESSGMSASLRVFRFPWLATS